MDKELFDGWDDVSPLADINVTPFIDIMLVLLIIFMVTAPLMLGGVHINLPKTGGDPMPRPESPLIVSLDAENRVFVDKEEVSRPNMVTLFQDLARNSANGEVFVRGDGMVRYKEMMALMKSLGEAGFARVTLVTDVRSEESAAVPEGQSGTLPPNPAVPGIEGQSTALPPPASIEPAAQGQSGSMPPPVSPVPAVPPVPPVPPVPANPAAASGS
jgi:biopolymer transport protein ExbD